MDDTLYREVVERLMALLKQRRALGKAELARFETLLSGVEVPSPEEVTVALGGAEQ